MTVAQRLKELRQRSGLSVRGLAEALGIPASSYQHYESKKYTKHYLDMGLCSDLARIFGNLGIDSGEVMTLAGFQELAGTQGQTELKNSGVAAGIEVLSGPAKKHITPRADLTKGVNVEKLQTIAQAVEELMEEMAIPINPAQKFKMIARLYNLLYESK
jgi:transcriptional regulator with XRE-family HTH domain